MLGTLFTRDFLDRGIVETAAWRALDETAFQTAKSSLLTLFEKFPVHGKPNEADTEDRLVYPITEILGFSRTQKTRMDDRLIPDAYLFLDEADRALADGVKDADKVRYANLILEAKKWGAPFDTRFDRDTPPMAQLMGYLSRAETRSNRRVRWGILTDGRKWRLSFMGAASLLTDFFEIDLAAALGVPGFADDLFAPRTAESQDHELRLFLLFFSAASFRPDGDGRTFQELALQEGRFWEERVRKSLSNTIFEAVFPGLLRALKAADREAPRPLTAAYLTELREAAFTFLYRLLFTLYAEDRDLLPRRYRDYDDYGLSARVRDDIENRIDKPDIFSAKRPDYYDVCLKVFEMIDEGDESVGVPPFNGGLFHRNRAPLLNRARIPDRTFAPLFDALSRTQKGGERVRINYRDLSVRELGAVYERLLEFEPAADDDKPEGIDIRLNAFARKGSGSYYTPDELVNLIVERTVGPLVEERRAAFAEAVATSPLPPIAGRGSGAAGGEGNSSIAEVPSSALRAPSPRERGEGNAHPLDPASAILELKICDPAMGSGHFLVALVDYLADRVFEAVDDARLRLGSGYRSPVIAEAERIRARIQALAAEHGWHVRDEMVDDRAIVRRMVLKRCVFGVDKNPMAVELAKVALWLHTLTAGAPLSFLDHHLKCGDSLFGEWVRPVMDGLANRGTLLINNAIRNAESASRGMATIESLTDADMAEAEQSRTAYEEVEQRTRPLKKFMDFWHASKWLDLSKEEAKARDALLDGAFGDAIRVAAGIDPPIAPPAEELLLFEREGAEQASLLGSGGASVRDYVRLREVLGKVSALVDQERFFHWQIEFPRVWIDWTSGERKGGFDAVVGNPPWDKVEIDDVTWFRSHDPAFAGQENVVKKTLRTEITGHKRAENSLWNHFLMTRARTNRALVVARASRNYPLTSLGRADLYALFQERSSSLTRADGLTGLLVPTGIVADKRVARHFADLSKKGQIRLVVDFENRRGLPVPGSRRRGKIFPDVHPSYRFSAYVTGQGRFRGQSLQFALMQGLDSIKAGQPAFLSISVDAISRFNPNTNTLALFATQRDIEIAGSIYSAAPLLRNGTEHTFGPLVATQMMNMSTDRGKLFFERSEIEKQGAYPVSDTEFKLRNRSFYRLFVGRMIGQHDHRFADVFESDTAEENEAIGTLLTAKEKTDPHRAATSLFWADEAAVTLPFELEYTLGFRDIARTTDSRTSIAAIVPKAGYGHTLPIIVPKPRTTEGISERDYKDALVLLCANLNALPFDYLARQKVQSTHLSWYILEQLPVIPPDAYARPFGALTAGEIVRDHVLRLSYTAWDLAPFALDMGYVDEAGETKPPIVWNEATRRQWRARLDALYFHLYGVTDESDIRYILSTFPIVERKDREAHDGVYLTAEMILWHFRALAAGDSETDAPVATLVRAAKAG